MRIRRHLAWLIVQETGTGTRYLALPLFNRGTAWTDDLALADIAFHRRDAYGKMKLLFPDRPREVRVVPVFVPSMRSAQ